MFLICALVLFLQSCPSTAQLQPGAFSISHGLGQPPQLQPQYPQRRSDREDTRQAEAKFLRPFGFRRPIVIRRPITHPQLVAPTYHSAAPTYHSAAPPTAVASSPYGAYPPARPVILRRPVRPIRPLGLRPFLRPMIRPVARPVIVRPAGPAASAQPNMIFTAPHQNPNTQRLPDIELRQMSRARQTFKAQRELIQRNFEDIKKPLLKIINTGAKIALHKVLQQQQQQQQQKQKQTKSQQTTTEADDADGKVTTAVPPATTITTTTQATKGKVGLEQLISGAEVVLKHYLEMKSRSNGSRAIQAQKRADLTRFQSALENNSDSKDADKKPIQARVKPPKGEHFTYADPTLSPHQANAPSDRTTPSPSTQTSRSPQKSTTTRSASSTTTTTLSTTRRPDGRTTSIPNLLRPWSSSNLLNLLKNTALYSVAPTTRRPSDEINWKPANVSLVDAKIVNDTKGRRVGYLPSNWYMDDSIGDASQDEIPLAKLTTVESSTLGSGSSRADFDADNSELVTTSSEEIPISAETVSSSTPTMMTTKRKTTVTAAATMAATLDSSEEQLHHQLVLARKPTAKRKPQRKTPKPSLMYSASDEAVRSEELPLWVLTTRKPTHSFGFGHSVVINNHRAPSQNGMKRRRTTTTRRPTTTTGSTTQSEETAEASEAEPLRYPTTTPLPPTSNAFPLEVFDTDAYNTTIVHQNIITIAKPTRPFSVRPTQKYQPTTLGTSPMPSSSSGAADVAEDSLSTRSPINWDDSEEIGNRVPLESRPVPHTVPPPFAASKAPPPTKAPHGAHSTKSPRKPSKTTFGSSAVADWETTTSSWSDATTGRPWTAAAQTQFGNKPIAQVPALLSPFGSLIQMFPNSLFRVLQTLGSLLFALPTMLTATFIAAMLFV